MEKRQYHKEMDSILSGLPKTPLPKLLLHSCCGPCSTAVLEQLMEHFEIVLFYYNPNIAPREEFEKRLAAQQQLLETMAAPNPITMLVPPYDDAPFWDAVRDVADTPEMGARCERCIAQRMQEAVRAAVQSGCEWFTTTLSVSPHKNAVFINTCGEQLEQESGVRYLPSDFKKRGGYPRSVALSEEYGLYRQDYCGCPMSLREAEERRRQREIRQNVQSSAQ
ncbi:MAG: epoxyqueuosine reductase QueH [Oscillospiraceae bacterium]|nr:epoxyqueuosine reductase QueH [Oscillospiraceae bacterium]